MFGILEGTGSTVLDPRFHRVIPGSARVERLWSGSRWAEGPAWFAAHNTLVWSDIPNDRMLRFDATTGQVGVFRQPARNSNGNTVDPQGRLVTCEHGARQVTRTEHDGGITVLASHWQGKRLNSPNDLVVNRTARSGSPIPITASSATMKATRRKARSGRATSIGSTGIPAR